MDMLQKTEPSILMIRLLETCNAYCAMCEFAGSKDIYRFTSRDAVQLCKILPKNQYKLIRFTGGEPLLSEDIYRIINCFKRFGLLVSMITNGWFLSEKYKKLVDAGLDQIVISCDGAEAETHDKYRRLPGLFQKLYKGIQKIKNYAPHVMIRVNTVVGPHNINEISYLYRLLGTWGVSQWSIIPLKKNEGMLKVRNIKTYQKYYKQFQMLVTKEKGPQLLGYSRNWAGRDPNEEEIFFNQNKSMTPKKQCQLVQHVRYYIPKDEQVFPCNCVPHRQQSIVFGSSDLKAAFRSEGIHQACSWLAINGPTHCCGCEPVNAALGDGIIDLKSNPLDF